MQAAIEVCAIGQHARSGRVTLRDVSLTVGCGELVAIIGGSGSGKTTLLDAMSGLRPPSSGTVLRAPRAPASQRQIGYVPSGDTLPPVIPLGRALRYTAALRALRVRDGAVEEVLRVVGLRRLAETGVGELDPGERKRAAIAAELLARPTLLFLEEPTGGLDPAQGAEAMRLLCRLRDAGTTVVLTTSNPLDAVRCDKVAVLAIGGHLAFFGTPAAACDYFAADSLDEIYERLAGLGDPATAWSRRFSRYSRTNAGPASPRTAPPQPGPARLVPDSAGPYSAGPPSTSLFRGQATLAGTGRAGTPRLPAPGSASRVLRPARQLAVLVARNAAALRRDRRAVAVLALAPLAVVAMLALLLPSGALGQAQTDTVALSWMTLGGFATGLAYGLPQVRREEGMLRAERFAGLSAVAYVLAKAALLLPALAVADAVIALVPAVSGRLPEGYGPAFLTQLLSSAAALALALAVSAAAMAPRPRALRALAALAIPAVLPAAALLALLDRPAWGDRLALAVITLALMTVTVIFIARAAPEGQVSGHGAA